MTKTGKITVVFMLPTLVAGGSERIMSFLAQNIDKTRFEPILLITAHKKDASYDVADVCTIFFEKSRVLFAIPQILFFLLKTKPMVVISAGGHLNTLMAYISFIFPNIKFVAREVNVLSVLSKFVKSKPNSFLRFIGKHRFKFFDKIICQSQDMKNDILKNYSVKEEKLTVINNPITDGFKPKQERKVNDVIKFITVARLVKQKGHERILKCLGQFKAPFHYIIVGDGSEKESLFTLIEKYGLSENITHIPFTRNVIKYLNDADLYLQGSYVEGFPNAIIESLATGTPVIAFNAPGGINEIIEEGINGYIVDESEEFLEKLSLINSNYQFSIKNVSKSVFEKYEASIIINKYENALSTWN